MSLNICEFGKYQKYFNRAREFNGSFREFVVTSGQSDKGKYYSMLFIIGSYKFRIRFEKTSNGLNDRFKSITYRTVEKDRETRYELEPHFDESEFDEMCSEWLAEVLFKKGYHFDKVSLMLPPRYESIMPGTCESKIDELVITVSNDEEDEYIVDWWLSRLCHPVINIKITSGDVEIVINENIILKKCSMVEICGKSDIDFGFIKNFPGNYLVYRGNIEFTDDQLKEIFVQCNESTSKKAIYLQQGTLQKHSELKKWLEETYTDYDNSVDYYLRKRSSCVFYFKMTEMEVIVGNFHGVYEAGLNPRYWPCESFSVFVKKAILLK